MGILFSFICAVVWILSDLASGSRYSAFSVIVWNTSVRLLYFLLHTLVFSKLLELIELHREYSYIDPVTHVANWRYFEDFTTREIRAATQKKMNLALAYIDIDNFKSVNDTFGHTTGDLVLVDVAETISKGLRKSDLLARLGGDEFAILLNDADREYCAEILDRIKRRAEESAAAKNYSVTLSIGCVVFTTFSSDLGAMLRQADELMYDVKRNGKNAIRIADQSATAAIRLPVRG